MSCMADRGFDNNLCKKEQKSYFVKGWNWREDEFFRLNINPE